MDRQSWWLDEEAHAGAEHLDADYVATYEAKAQYDPAEDVERLSALGLDAASTVLDIGAGTGVFAMAVAARAGTVIAVDVSPAMCRVIGERATKSEVSNVIVQKAGFLTYAGDPHSVDFVFTRNAMHQIPDFWKVVALRRIHDLLKPGGVLLLHDLVYDIDTFRVADSIDRWVSGGVDDPALGYTPNDLAEHVRSEYSTFSWLFDRMLDKTGFEVMERHFRRDVYATYTCRAL
ncbi:MAG: class I SAM-dependent methyltransferase [Acidimicrobiia bacterium]